jgi:beta-glucosidase
MKEFPEGFVWGAASAAYQVEGGVNQGGRGETVWDRFCRTPGKIKNGDTGDVACDHYNRYKEDVAIMKEIGLQAYRFSMAWSRIFPDGKGKINQQGVDFYRSLVDELLENGITPYITLFHWDTPQALQDKGGWANRDTALYFRDYAAAAVQALGDRVKNWMALNEPGVYVICGNLMGIHAPGLSDLSTGLHAAHHLLFGHGLALRAMRDVKSGLSLGIALDTTINEPATDKPEDAEAAKRCEATCQRWYIDPIFKGDYPELGKELYKGLLPEIRENDMEIIHTPMDWLGLNYYKRTVVVHDGDNDMPWKARPVTPEGAPVTDFGWEIHADSFYRWLKIIQQEYDPPAIYITENGASFGDGPDEDGLVNDQRRIDYLNGHIGAVHSAIQDGVRLRGYFQWSIMDNFEWSEGYSQRFGIVYVDYKTQKRIIKESGRWYSRVIQANGLEEQA